MPQVTFLGPYFERRGPDGRTDFTRAKPQKVSQAWLDQWRGRLPASHWRIEGDAGESLAARDGVPDSSWRRKDILTWLADYAIKPAGYATKSTLLNLVMTVMNPEQVEETEELVQETVELVEEEENNEELEFAPVNEEGE